MTPGPAAPLPTGGSASPIVRALSIAGSDPSGGAGIQADLKSFAAQGAYGMAAIASLTAQNTRGVRVVHSPPADFLLAQLEAISDDIVVDTVKIGMLGNAENIAVVADWLERHRPEFVVLDPVMIATSGDRLLDADAERALQALLPLADVLTPNVDELAVLVDDSAAPDLEAAIEQGRRLAAAAGTRVLVKGGHLARLDEPDGAVVATDALVAPDGAVVLLPGPFVRTKNTHGTGCSLSSALAALRPQRDSWAQAAADAKVWLTGALAGSDLLRVGSGAGPVHHFHELWPAPRFSAEMWERISPIREAITTMPFIQALSDGSLPWPNFSFYLTQDALYLREYARSLARVAALAPDQDAQVFFAQASAGALEAELSLHRSLLADDRSSAPAPAVPPTRPCAATALASPVTAGYTDHLNRACAGGDYPEAVAAVLPCFWLYQHIGELLAGRAAQWGGTGAHPYAAWIDTYGDPAFAELTEQAIALTDRAAATASVLQRTAMAAAFERSSQYEWMFFAQGTDLPDWPV